MPHRIIVADDDVNVRSVLVRIIHGVYPDALVTTVADGSAALAVFDAHGADVLVTNRAMLPVDGITLIRTLRVRGVAIPIVATSSMPSAQAEMIAAGATVFLTKIDAVNQLETLLPTLLPR